MLMSEFIDIQRCSTGASLKQHCESVISESE